MKKTLILAATVYATAASAQIAPPQEALDKFNAFNALHAGTATSEAQRQRIDFNRLLVTGGNVQSATVANTYVGNTRTGGNMAALTGNTWSKFGNARGSLQDDSTKTRTPTYDQMMIGSVTMQTLLAERNADGKGMEWLPPKDENVAIRRAIYEDQYKQMYAHMERELVILNHQYKTSKELERNNIEREVKQHFEKEHNHINMTINEINASYDSKIKRIRDAHQLAFSNETDPSRREVLAQANEKRIAALETERNLTLIPQKEELANLLKEQQAEIDSLTRQNTTTKKHDYRKRIAELKDRYNQIMEEYKQNFLNPVTSGDGS